MSQKVNFQFLLLLIMAVCVILAPYAIAGGASTTTGGVGITLNKTDSTDPIDASTQLNYTILINITNLEHAISNISNLTLTDTYPDEVIYISAQPTPLSGTNNTFIIGNFTTNSTFMVNITVLVRNITNGTLINNTANISFTNATATRINITVTENTTVLNPPLYNFTNFSVTKTDSPDPVNASTNLTYQINVTSNGNGTAYNLVVNETYPDQVVYLDSSPAPLLGTNNTFMFGNALPGWTISINITVLVLNITNGTIINNSVFYYFTNETLATINCTVNESTTVLNPPLYNLTNISATKTDSPDPVTAGSNLVYQINVTSTGNGTAYNVVVNETYPPQAIYQTAQPLPTLGTNYTFIVPFNMGPGQNFSINITLSVPSSLPDGIVINNTANISFDNETNGRSSFLLTASTTVSNPPTPSGGGSGGGGGGGVSYGRTYTMSANSQSFTLKRAEKVLFKVGTTQHTLTILSVSPTSVLVQLYSSPQQLQLAKGVPQEADLNNDGRMDVRLTLTTKSYYDAIVKIEILGAECTENWVCNPWGECTAGKQTRECTDMNSCGTTTLKPKTSQSCTPEIKPLPKPAPEEPPAETYKPEPVVVVEPKAPKAKMPALDKAFYALAIIALVALGFYLYWMRRKK